MLKSNVIITKPLQNDITTQLSKFNYYPIIMNILICEDSLRTLGFQRKKEYMDENIRQLTKRSHIGTFI